jgi:hypothetical protein
MRLDTFLLADAVATPQDGKFYIHGGGLSRFEVPDIPFPMPLAMFARFEVSDSELLTSHSLFISLIGPAGLPNIPPLEIVRAPDKALEPILDGEQRFMQIALSLTALVVRVGVYHMEISVDGEKLGSIPLPVVIADAQPEVAQEMPAAAKTKRPPPPPKKAKRRTK